MSCPVVWDGGPASVASGEWRVKSGEWSAEGIGIGKHLMAQLYLLNDRAETDKMIGVSIE